jgi:hypothetical protein
VPAATAHDSAELAAGYLTVWAVAALLPMGHANDAPNEATNASQTLPQIRWRYWVLLHWTSGSYDRRP